MSNSYFRDFYFASSLEEWGLILLPVSLKRLSERLVKEEEKYTITSTCLQLKCRMFKVCAGNVQICVELVIFIFMNLGFRSTKDSGARKRELYL